MARIRVNSICNVVTDEHSNAYRSYGQTPAPEITVPDKRLRLSIQEARTLAAALTEAIAVAEAETK